MTTPPDLVEKLVGFVGNIALLHDKARKLNKELMQTRTEIFHEQLNNPAPGHEDWQTYLAILADQLEDLQETLKHSFQEIHRREWRRAGG